MLSGIMEASFLGVDVPLSTGSTIELGGVVSEMVTVGSDSDFKNMVKPSEIVLTVAYKKGMTLLSTFPAGVAGELQCRMDTGQIYTWSNAVRTGTLPVNPGEGTVKVTLGAGAPIEMVQ